MQKILRGIMRLCIAIVLVIVLAFASFIGYTYITMYRPEPVETISVKEGLSSQPIQKQTSYGITTFNTGYAALGQTQDFFMDGGVKSGADSKEEVLDNLQFITNYIFTQNNDFIFLQEVDIDAKRSYHVNQLAPFVDSKYSSSFALNFDTPFVPIPLTHPMGGGESGIATLSLTTPKSAERFTLDGEEPFIKQLFDLKRAFTLTRFEVQNGNDLVLINTHFSAFDKGGKVRAQQLAQMQDVLIAEREAGNYVILGGDFNHELPGTSSEQFTWTDSYPEWCMVLPDDFTPVGYTWATDGTQPSVRANNKAYTAGTNFVAVIDGFVVSDNIQIEQVTTRGDFEFIHSDHNPVELRFSLQ